MGKETSVHLSICMYFLNDYLYYLFRTVIHHLLDFCILNDTLPQQWRTQFGSRKLSPIVNPIRTITDYIRHLGFGQHSLIYGHGAGQTVDTIYIHTFRPGWPHSAPPSVVTSRERLDYEIPRRRGL